MLYSVAGAIPAADALQYGSIRIKPHAAGRASPTNEQRVGVVSLGESDYPAITIIYVGSKLAELHSSKLPFTTDNSPLFFI